MLFYYNFLMSDRGLCIFPRVCTHRRTFADEAMWCITGHSTGASITTRFALTAIEHSVTTLTYRGVTHKKVCHFIFIPHYNCKVNGTPVRFRSTNTVYKRCAAAGTDSCILHHCNLIFT